MMTRYSALLLLAVVPLGACRELPAKEAPKAVLSHTGMPTEQLDARVVSRDDMLAAPLRVSVVGDRLVVLDAYADRAVHIVRRSDGVLERSFGRRGRGPGEFEKAWSVDPVPGSDRAFWVYDAVLRRATHVDLATDFADGGAPGDRMLRIKADVTLMDPVWVGGDRMVALGLFPAGRLGHLDADGMLVRTSGVTPLPEMDLPAHVRQHAYQSTMEPNPSRTLLAVATRHADRVDIFNADGRRVAINDRPFNFEPVFGVREKGGQPVLASGEDLRFGYIDLATTEDRIYALYSGQTRGSAPGRANFGRFIHVYDWAGQLRQVFQLDAPAISVAVTQDGRTLYAVQHDPAPAVVEYRMANGMRLALAD